MMTTKVQLLTETAIMSALAIVFNYLVLFQMPQGGSVSLTFVPIILLSLKYGLLTGSISGLITGVISLVFGGYFLNPIQVLFDYILAFALIGLAGIFSAQFKKALKQKQSKKAGFSVIMGGLVGGIFSLISHFLAGIFFYQSFAPEGQPVWLYSLVYNSSYVIPDTILAIIIVLILINRIPSFFIKS